MTNDSGMVVTSHEYLPFGEDWITEGDTKNAPKYNSQELDKESGYYFYNARHYDPEIARFVTPDTVIDGELSTQGWNRYAYVHNNPIEYKDPTGHSVSGSWGSGASGSWTEGGASKVNNLGDVSKQISKVSQANSADKNNQFIAVRDELRALSKDIYRFNLKKSNNDAELAMGKTIGFIAKSLLDNTSIKYGASPGNVHFYDSTMRDSNKSTYFGTDWEGGKDPLKNYKGNRGQPKLDCAAFVGLVLDIAGITEGTKGRGYGAPKGMNLTNSYNSAVENIVNRSTFKDVSGGQVRIGDIAYTGDKGHIMIVSEVNNGVATKYIHSSPIDYNTGENNQKGVQESSSGGSIFYKRYNGDITR